MKERYSFWKMLKGKLFSLKGELAYFGLFALCVPVSLLIDATVKLEGIKLEHFLVLWLALTVSYTILCFLVRSLLKLIYITLLWYVLNSSECDEEMVEYYKEIVG